MKKQKVRPMVDKELRDEVVGYFIGVGSFNEALRWHIIRAKQLSVIIDQKAELIATLEDEIADLKSGNCKLSSEAESELVFTRLELQANKSHSMALVAKNQEIKNQLKRDAEELHRLNKINFELSTKLDGTDKAYKALLELYMDKRGSRLTYLRWGIVFGLVAGLTIGYLFL